MRSSVFFKSFIGYVIIVVLLSGLVLLLSFGLIRNHYISILTKDLESLGTTMKQKITPMISVVKPDTLDKFVKRLGAEIGTRITIIDSGGVVLADSEKDPKSMENHKRRLEIRQALDDKTGTSLRFSRTVKQEMLYVAVPVKKDGKIIGVVRVSLFLSDINSLLNDLKVKIFQVTFIIILVSLLLAYFFARGLSKPIKELVNASRNVASGDFDVTVLFKRNDELKELADSFNHMVTQIKDLVTELSLEKEALNTLITSIQEGIIVIDKKGTITLSNDSFRKIVNTSLIEGNPYWKLIRTPNLSTLVDTITKGERDVASAEIEIEGRYFICSAALISTAEQIVISLHDITEITKVAAVKKDFVANVSHELRTPLTAIKGFVETLEEDKSAKSRQYLKIIKRHTERLINIIQDLQLLSELEETEKLEREEVNLKKLLVPILKLFDQKVKEKNLEFKLKGDKRLPKIHADPFKLEQMFINLIDNAVKYTEKGEIVVSITKKDNAIRIEIEDTGIGIPKEHLSRIFERFYVIDKSRSRKMGGTGLGLSIVKHIVQIHNGTIEVKSEVGIGSSFTIKLPIGS